MTSAKPVDVEEVFAFMLARYGSAWEAKFGVANLDLVKADWAQQLYGLSADAVAFGLSHLPVDYPPTSTLFAGLCRADSRRRREPLPETYEHPRLPGIPSPVLTREQKEALLEKPRQAFTTTQRDPKAWAWALKARDEAGEPLTITQRAMYRVVTDDASVEMPETESERQRTAQLKAEAQRKAAAYAEAHGVDLTPPPAKPEPPSSMPAEPERFAQEDEA